MSRVLSEDYDTISGSEQGHDKNSWLGGKVVDKSLLMNSLIHYSYSLYRVQTIALPLFEYVQMYGKSMAIIL